MKTEGVILKSKNLGDRLRYLSVYTEKLGKLNLLVKLQSNDFPIKYELFSVTLFKLQQKGKNWEILEGNLIKENFPRTPEEFKFRVRITKLLTPLELAPSSRIYTLLKKYIAENGNPPTYTAFLVKFLFLEGLMPQLFRCIKCGSRNVSWFSVEKGGVLCKNCREGETIRWNRSASMETLILIKEPLESLKKRRFKWLNRIELAAEKHLRYRTEK